LALAKAAHLEITGFPEPPLAMWGTSVDERMVGTISFDSDRGLPVVGRIAVSQAYRGSGLGRRLLNTLEGEARRRRLDELSATARAPDFFVPMGYSVVGLGKERHPQAVRKTFVP
jgi:N-acetylglutamate synthase-like GNAT family acetyltransferase